MGRTTGDAFVGVTPLERIGLSVVKQGNRKKPRVMDEARKPDLLFMDSPPTHLASAEGQSEIESAPNSKGEIPKHYAANVGWFTNEQSDHFLVDRPTSGWSGL